MFGNVIHRVEAGSDEMTDIQVDANVWGGCRHGSCKFLGPIVFIRPSALSMIVHAHLEFVLLGKLVHSLGHTRVGRSGDHMGAQCFGHEESLLDLCIRHFFAKTVIVSAELNTSVLELFASLFKERKRRIQSPLPQRLRLEIFWLQMALPQFTAIDADLYNGVNGLLEGAITETITLNSDLHTMNHRTRRFLT